MTIVQKCLFTLSILAMNRILLFRNRVSTQRRVHCKVVEAQMVSQVFAVKSGMNNLDARFVKPTEGVLRAAVLICHGIGESVVHWDAAQRLLAHSGVASLVFDYSGFGKSTGCITLTQCETDAVAAFALLQQLTDSVPLSILGYSLGSGLAVAVAARLKPDRLVLCAAYTSLREAAASLGVPRALTHLLPARWASVDALSTYTVPVLVVHGQADRLFPVQMAWQLGNACASECEVIISPGLSHNAPVFRPQSEYWFFIGSWLCGLPKQSRCEFVNLRDSTARR